MATSRKKVRKKMPSRPRWARWPAEKLLQARLCDLGLRLEGTIMEERIRALFVELEGRGLRFRPHFWLSDEWFSPGGVPGVAIPFYLTHPRLVRLETSQMREAEGGSRSWCMRILRHETGHALDHAYRLRRRRRWQQLFGHSSQRYPTIYRPRPFSRHYVHNLDSWYAQSHPDEDFAETFAVWLAPRAAWRRQYQGWPALAKLEYMNELMEEVGQQTPPVRTRRQVDPVSELRKTLGEHYQERRLRYGIDDPTPHDRQLKELFSQESRHAHREAASVFLRRLRPEALETVCRWTGQPSYTVDQILKEMISRCRTLRLRVRPGRTRAREDLIALLTMKTLHDLQRSRLHLTL